MCELIHKYVGPKTLAQSTFVNKLPPDRINFIFSFGIQVDDKVALNLPKNYQSWNIDQNVDSEFGSITVYGTIQYDPY